MKKLFILILLGIMAMLPVSAQDDAPVIDDNITDTCVTDFDPDVDYFPEKVEIVNAQKFTIDYFNNYKVVTVEGSLDTFNYVLVQCGTPAPSAEDFPEDTQFIDVPTGNIISLSTTFLPGIVELGLVDQLVGVDNVLYTSTPEIIQRVEDGNLIAVAPNFELNFELMLETEPNIVITDDYNTERIASLIDADIFTAVAPDYLETSPLGYAEWVKFTSLFYNREAEATTIYDEIVSSYNEARALVADIREEDRPIVLWNVLSAFSEAWSIPGAETYAGQFIRDAGGVIALGDEVSETGDLLSIEAVYDGGLDADIWVINLFGARTYGDLLAQDVRYADFAAFQNDAVWNNDLDVTENGGNNYYELGATNPDLVLKDLIAIFHPEILPDHEFNFFQLLDD
jgi:iron complex transport system substrate-binding protein